MKPRDFSFRALSLLGAAIGYGCLAAFLWLVSTQIHRWFRDSEWTHIGMNHALRATLNYCCAKSSSEGWLAGFSNWLDSPSDWLGVHRVFEVVPASLALFALSILGNCVFIYCRDRVRPAAS